MMSPQVLTAAIPPKKTAMPVNTLIFPANFSGAKTSSRMNLVKADSFKSCMARGRGVAP